MPIANLKYKTRQDEQDVTGLTGYYIIRPYIESHLYPA